MLFDRRASCILKKHRELDREIVERVSLSKTVGELHCSKCGKNTCARNLRGELQCSKGGKNTCARNLREQTWAKNRADPFPCSHLTMRTGIAILAQDAC